MRIPNKEGNENTVSEQLQERKDFLFFLGRVHGVVATYRDDCGERHILYICSVTASVMKGG